MATTEGAAPWDDKFVTADDVAPFVSADALDVADVLLSRVNERVGEVWATTGGTPDTAPPSHVRDVALEAAVRLLDNPRGRDSTTISSDGTSVTDRYTQRSSATAGVFRVGLTAQEKARITGRRRRRYGTVRTRLGY